MKPKRIRLSRVKGWRMPTGAVKVDRSTRWGNQFRIGAPYDAIDDGGVVVGSYVVENAKDAVACYDNYIRSEFGSDLYDAARQELRGKDLACWCKLGEPCHADVLLEIANSEEHPATASPNDGAARVPTRPLPPA